MNTIQTIMHQFKEEPSPEYIALHTVWASQIWKELHDDGGLSEVDHGTKESLELCKETYPIELVPVVGLGMNIMFQNDMLGIKLLRHYGIHEDIIHQCRVYVFG